MGSEMNHATILQPVLGLVAWTFLVLLLIPIARSARDAALAWSYVMLRVVLSLVHLTYNKVLHRLSVFALSNVVLAGLWIALFLALPR